MSVHLQREIERVKKSILALCAIVEDQVQAAVQALLERDVDLARSVEQRDRDIDQREVEVEEECLKILALHQPVAIDLRFIVAAMKINNDLERIGDLAVNIARKAVSFAAEPPMAIAFRHRRHVGEDPGHAPRQSRRAGEHGRGVGGQRLPPRRRGGSDQARDPHGRGGADSPRAGEGPPADADCWRFPATWSGSPTAPRTSPRT